MIVRSYTGRTVPEALAKVRTDLGDNALIIETRAIREPGLLGRRSGYEVVAAHDDRDDSSERDARERSGSRSTLPAVRGAASAASAAGDSTAATTRFSPSAPLAGQAANLALDMGRNSPAAEVRTGLEDELAAIRNQLALLTLGQSAPATHLDPALAAQLVAQELPNDLVGELDHAMEQVAGRLDPAKQDEFLTRLMARALPCIGAIDWSTCRRLMVVGPTGVGKTTTIAKLAGELVLQRKRRVALATIDTYRVGATEQLRAYADLLDIPLEVASSPAQLTTILRRFESYDNVLIDTSGRSPADSARVHELKSYCRAATGGMHVMLAIAATCGRAEFAAIVERFSLLPIEHTVITKMDECVAVGRLYGCLRRHRLPLNYITTGQEVPDDISPAQGEDIVRGLVEAQTGIPS